MDNLARERRDDDGELRGVRGRVERKSGDELVVSTPAGDVSARRAASCLIEAHVGNEVMLALGGDGRAWVLAVLEKEASRSTEIAVEGDLRLRSSRGKVALVGQEGIDLISAGTTKIVSNEVELRARTAAMMVDGVELIGGWAKVELEKVKLLANSLDQVLDRFSQRVRRSYRRVEDVDRLEAGAVHQRIETTLRVHARDTAMTADGLVKIDGKQIHVG